ncbi:potassium transporter TrkG [Lactobacillus sp.]|uniref:TrkH family potassium uptake protein n=2 Tax=Lactobacillus sp. TaxID=1591 RepID=UPI0019BEBC87|nr:potassium transporter TrkG [Lactobacillus sp.]MBD5429668.1 Trk family potassium uptake protein [Lactobacillus sp.]
MIEIYHHKYTFPKVLTLGFVFIILIGTLLLLLPISTKSGHTDFMTALFTSTSATCVTGLSVVHTSTHWSFFGQLIIAVLMEVGGLGFMTFAVLMSRLIRQRMQMSTKLLAKEAWNFDNLSQVNVIFLILRLSIAIQLLGSALLLVKFYPRYGLAKGIWYSIFHSIAAFCNAGFDLFDHGLAEYINDPYVLGVLAMLIIAGSLGFLVWKDILDYHRTHRLSLHTILALRTGAIITILSIIVYFITEKNLAQLSNHVNFGERIVNTIFMAITPRTAGLTTFSYTDLSATGLAFTTLLMFIGGTPGSTAGGIKTTTIGILTIQTIATLRGKRDTTLAHRRFTQENIFRALTLLFVALFILFIAILILIETQTLPERNPLGSIVFEAVSAFGTTGISVGVTQNLNLIGKLIIIFLMFIGRVGIFTVMFSIFNTRKKPENYRYPKESVLIG